MSAPTGITLSPELRTAFSDAVDSSSTRFLKISIQNESLVLAGTTPRSGTLEQDLDRLADIIEESVPAYVLARLDDPPTDWLAIFYVPDSAKVRDKMLYAATRTTLTKSLGPNYFADSLFATDKGDLNADGYARHRRHLAAPKPMSAREKEMEAVKAAEREAGGRTYEGNQARLSHVGQGLGVKWYDDAQNAVKELGAGEGSHLVILSIDPSDESVVLKSSAPVEINDLGAALPASDPCFAIFAWPQSVTSPPRRVLVPIYSCPSSSPVKHRMLYSSSALGVFRQAKELLSQSGSAYELASRKVETSDPSELDERHLISELGLTASATTSPAGGTPSEEADKRPFARPKGPGRKPR